MAGRVVPVATGESLPERPCESMPGRLVHPILESSRGRFAAATLQKFPCGKRAEYCTSVAAPTRGSLAAGYLFKVQSKIQGSYWCTVRRCRPVRSRAGSVFELSSAWRFYSRILPLQQKPGACKPSWQEGFAMTPAVFLPSNSRGSSAQSSQMNKAANRSCGLFFGGEYRRIGNCCKGILTMAVRLQLLTGMIRHG